MGHGLGHGFPELLFSLKHLVFLLLAAAGIWLLWSRRITKVRRAAVLAGALLLLGGIAGLLYAPLARPLGLHPSPMCALTKLIGFGWLQGRLPPAMLAALLMIVALSLVGKKLFCGWACPMGALQELLYLVPGVKKLRNLPFMVTNSVRAALFGAYLVCLLAFGVLLYGYVNAFELFHWELEHSLTVTVVSVLVLSLFYYRPFCYLICPIGLLSWVFERPAYLGVRFDAEACTDCGECREKAPCPCLPELLAGRKGWLPDCTSCGLCMEACPSDALRFGPGKG